MGAIVNLKDAGSKALYGGKAANLSKLLAAGLPVPSGFAVSVKAFSEGKLTEAATGELKRMIDESKLYAVRSSALNEDAEGASWAGQFETFLNVAPTAVVSSIENCHNTTKIRAKAYGREMGDAAKFDVAVER